MVEICEVAVQEGVDLGGMVNAQLGYLLLSLDHAMIEVGSMGSCVVSGHSESCLEVLSAAFHLLNVDGDCLFT